jgi:phospholipase/lecithinase/hemolysin
VHTPSTGLAAMPRYFVVGDSYTDNGNFAALNPDTVDPESGSNPYPSLRSNGPVWLSQLFRGQDTLPGWTVPPDSPPPSTARVINYAVARATTGYELTLQVGGWLLPTYAPYGMQWQFENMHRRYTFTPDDTLIIWGGVNDLMWAATAAAMNSSRRLLEELRTPLPLGGAGAMVAQATANTMTLVERAVKFGFGRIVVVTTGKDTLVPLLDEATARIYNNAAAGLEAAVAKSVERAAQSWPNIRISRLDLTTGLHARVEAAALRLDQPCLQDGNVCDAPDHYLYWDWTHPTTTGHCLIAQIVQEHLAAGAHLAEPILPAVHCADGAGIE